MNDEEKKEKEDNSKSNFVLFFMFVGLLLPIIWNIAFVMTGGYLEPGWGGNVVFASVIGAVVGFWIGAWLVSD